MQKKAEKWKIAAEEKLVEMPKNHEKLKTARKSAWYGASDPAIPFRPDVQVLFSP